MRINWEEALREPCRPKYSICMHCGQKAFDAEELDACMNPGCIIYNEDE